MFGLNEEFGGPSEKQPGLPVVSNIQLEKARPSRDFEEEERSQGFAPTQNGEHLLDDLEDCFERHIVIPTHARIACSLWVVHTHCYELFFHTPRLHIKSPTWRCGKSALLSVLEKLVHAPILASGLSEAVLFRVINDRHPTILLDEWDSLATGGKLLRNVLNSGFARNGFTWRVQGNQAREFRTFAPIAVASIGGLPETIADRSIIIPLKRKLRTEKVESGHFFEGKQFQEACVRWVRENSTALLNHTPQIPDLLNDRQADCWRSLLTIAEVAGGRWGERAREAAIHFASAMGGDDSKESLLRDIREIFEVVGGDRIFIKELLRRLLALDGSPWRSLNGQCLTKNKLSRLLSDFGIVSGTRRQGGQTDKGYLWEQFQDAWDRYL